MDERNDMTPENLMANNYYYQKRVNLDPERFKLNLERAIKRKQRESQPFVACDHTRPSDKCQIGNISYDELEDFHDRYWNCPGTVNKRIFMATHLAVDPLDNNRNSINITYYCPRKDGSMDVICQKSFISVLGVSKHKVLGIGHAKLVNGEYLYKEKRGGKRFKPNSEGDGFGMNDRNEYNGNNGIENSNENSQNEISMIENDNSTIFSNLSTENGTGLNKKRKFLNMNEENVQNFNANAVYNENDDNATFDTHTKIQKRISPCMNNLNDDDDEPIINILQPVIEITESSANDNLKKNNEIQSNMTSNRSEQKNNLTNSIPLNIIRRESAYEDPEERRAAREKARAILENLHTQTAKMRRMPQSQQHLQQQLQRQHPQQQQQLQYPPQIHSRNLLPPNHPSRLLTHQQQTQQNYSNYSNHPSNPLNRYSHPNYHALHPNHPSNLRYPGQPSNLRYPSQLNPIMQRRLNQPLSHPNWAGRSISQNLPHPNKNLQSMHYMGPESWQRTLERNFRRRQRMEEVKINCNHNLTRFCKVISIPHEDLVRFHNAYWDCQGIVEERIFLARFMVVTPCNHRREMAIATRIPTSDGQLVEVCQKSFLSVVGITKHKVQAAARAKLKGTLFRKDQRGGFQKPRPQGELDTESGSMRISNVTGNYGGQKKDFGANELIEIGDSEDDDEDSSNKINFEDSQTGIGLDDDYEDDDSQILSAEDAFASGKLNYEEFRKNIEKSRTNEMYQAQLTRMKMELNLYKTRSKKLTMQRKLYFIEMRKLRMENIRLRKIQKQDNFEVEIPLKQPKEETSKDKLKLGKPISQENYGINSKEPSTDNSNKFSASHNMEKSQSNAEINFIEKKFLSEFEAEQKLMNQNGEMNLYRSDLNKLEEMSKRYSGEYN